MIENKKIRLSRSGELEEFIKLFEGHYNYIQNLTAFGWQQTQTVSERHGRSTHHYCILARETSMEHYDDLRKLENEYEAAKSQIKSYRSMEISTVLLLFLLFIVPGIIYVNYKKCQKMDY